MKKKSLKDGIKITTTKRDLDKELKNLAKEIKEPNLDKISAKTKILALPNKNIKNYNMDIVETGKKKKIKVKKVRAKKEIVETKVEYPSLSENYEEDLELSYSNLHYDNELIDLENQLNFDKEFDRIVKTFFICFVILIIGLIIIFI